MEMRASLPSAVKASRCLGDFFVYVLMIARVNTGVLYYRE